MSFEKLDELKARRTALQTELREVNTAITTELDSMHARVMAMMTEFGRSAKVSQSRRKRGPQTPESRQRLSASMRARWAALKAQPVTAPAVQ